MNSDLLSDWNWIRIFLAVCEKGSVSQAAQVLGLSQPTLSRQIQQMELKTQLNLFKRTTQGLIPTESALGLLDSCKKMQEIAFSLEREITGQGKTLEGDIRISVNELVGAHLLPNAIREFQKKHENINVELLIDNDVCNLNRREADIALRMFRPEQSDLVVKRLPDLPLGLFAHESYLSEFSEPRIVGDLLNHKLIGFDEVSSYLDLAKSRGWPLTRSSFTIRTDNLNTQIALLKAGAGLVVTHLELGLALPNVKQVLCEIDIPPLEFWLVCHHDVHYNQNIQSFMHFLGEWFREEPYKNALI